MARDGEFDRAIARLQALRLAYPGDIPIASDLTVILGWAGRDREMLEVFETIGPDAAFDYTLFAAARSARAVGELDRADSVPQARRRAISRRAAVGVAPSAGLRGRRAVSRKRDKS